MSVDRGTFLMESAKDTDVRSMSRPWVVPYTSTSTVSPSISSTSASIRLPSGAWTVTTSPILALCTFWTNSSGPATVDIVRYMCSESRIDSEGEKLRMWEGEKKSYCDPHLIPSYPLTLTPSHLHQSSSTPPASPLPSAAPTRRRRSR